ncbi:MAG: S-layer homology domain-containing protein [Candidatus Abawacabacteria bacterium]|nr:S-layer homology domain-containing protein [Candidatus Abawacabacteria bacterium]
MKSNKFITLVVLFQVLLASSSVSAASNFSDVPVDHVYAHAIQVLKDKGIVRGYDGIRFGPEQLITRAELLKIALEGADIDTSDQKNSASPFIDLDTKHSLRQYVIYAKENNIVSGYSDSSYRPNQPTTRAEAIKILLNVNAIVVPPAITRSPYQDLRNNDPIAPFVMTAREKKVIPAKYEATNLGAGEHIKRGEVAEMMYRLLYLKENNLSEYPENTASIVVVTGNHPVDVFKNITVQTPIAKTMVANTYYPISVTTTAAIVKVIIEDNHEQQSVWEYKVENGRATFDIFFPSPGQYHIALLADDSKQAASLPVAILEKWLIGSEGALEAIAGAQFSGDENQRMWLMWSGAAGRKLLQLTCEQGNKKVTRLLMSAGEKWELDYQMFYGFVEGNINCSLAQANAESTIATEQPLSSAYSWSFPAITHHFRTWDQKNLTLTGALPLFTEANSLSLQGKAKIPLANTAAIILPSGNVQTFSLQAGDQEVLNSDIPWQLQVDLNETGVYFLEINDTEGLAVLNTPIYRQKGIPVLPDFIAKQEGVVITNKTPLTPSERTDMVQELLRRINALRVSQDRDPVVLDTTLSIFAQAHADDMVAQNYFSHRDKSGRGPDQRRQRFDVTLPVGENIALSIDIDAIDEGLNRSAVHRLNTLRAQWAQVGIGIARGSDGLLYAVEEFSTRSFIARPMTEAEQQELQTMTLERLNLNRANEHLFPLTIGTEFQGAIDTWEANPKGTDLKSLLLAAGMKRGRVLSIETDYSPHLPAELSLQTALSEPGITKMIMGIAFVGERMHTRVVFY